MSSEKGSKRDHILYLISVAVNVKSYDPAPEVDPSYGCTVGYIKQILVEYNRGKRNGEIKVTLINTGTRLFVVRDDAGHNLCSALSLLIEWQEACGLYFSPHERPQGKYELVKGSEIRVPDVNRDDVWS